MILFSVKNTIMLSNSSDSTLEFPECNDYIYEPISRTPHEVQFLCNGVICEILMMLEYDEEYSGTTPLMALVCKQFNFVVNEMFYPSFAMLDREYLCGDMYLNYNLSKNQRLYLFQTYYSDVSTFDYLWHVSDEDDDFAKAVLTTMGTPPTSLNYESLDSILNNRGDDVYVEWLKLLNVSYEELNQAVMNECMRYMYKYSSFSYVREIYDSMIYMFELYINEIGFITDDDSCCFNMDFFYHIASYNCYCSDAMIKKRERLEWLFFKEWFDSYPYTRKF